MTATVPASPGYTPDATIHLDSEGGVLLVYLANGGEQFPWTSHNGKVIIGPPSSARTSDGTALGSLEWRVDKFWVIEAFDQEGELVELNPAQYELAVTSAAQDEAWS